ncbi:MAG: sugar ABC transporter permease [Candidatus Moranbacteria bacterium]|nr:sugar ABC transporter permease [Candidatus Moranbacteria bacterium]
MKKVIIRIKQGLLKMFDLLQTFYSRYVEVIFDKIGYVLTHNPILRIKGQKLIFFSLISLHVTRKRRDAYYGYLFILLWLIGFIAFTLYPMFYSFYLSFHVAYYSLQTGVVTTFTGFGNYLAIFRSQVLIPLYVTYLGKMILAVPLIIVFSIMIAVLINNPIKLKGFWRTIFFLPVVISTGPVIGELTNQNATSLPSLSDSEVLLFISENLGDWLARPIEVLLTSMLLILWYAGIPILIFLAGLQKIDLSIYEAASIDGASPWDRFWKITLPSIKPLISVSIIYVVVSMSLFVEPGGILDMTRTHMLVGAPDSNFWFGYGYAAAMAWIYFFLMVLIMVTFIGLLSIKGKER